MAILNPDGVLLVDAIPVHTPGYKEATLARLNGSLTYYYYNGSTWITVKVGDDTPYDATTWNNNLNVPTMNAIRDKIESLMSGGMLVDGDYGDVSISGGGTVISIDSGLNVNKLANGSVSNTQFQYLSGVTSNIQTQLDAKAADAAVVKLTGNQTVAGAKTFSSDVTVPDDPYDATTWNGNNAVPTKNAIRDKIESLAVDGNAVHKTGDETVGGVKTFTDHPVVPADPYSGSWNGSNQVPTKDAVYDIVETKANDNVTVKTSGNQSIGGTKTFTSDVVVPAEVFGPGWDGSNEAPTKNDVYDEMVTRAKDAEVMHLTGDETSTGQKTFDKVVVADEAYDATSWNGDNSVPTKNAVRDKLEALLANFPIAQYKVLLTQTGTSAPTEAETHSNTLGGNPALTRPSGAGTYLVTLLNAFPIGKCQIQHSVASKHASVEITHTSASVLTITVRATTDAVSLSDLDGSIMLSVEIFA